MGLQPPEGTPQLAPGQGGLSRAKSSKFSRLAENKSLEVKSPHF